MILENVEKKKKELEEKQKELTRDFYLTFNSDHGKRVLDYLQVITINNILGPKNSNDELRHLEGQRYLFGLIKQLYEKGKVS